MCSVPGVRGVLGCPPPPEALSFTHHLHVAGIDLCVESSLCVAVGDVGPGQVGVKLAWLLFLTRHRGNGLL